MRLSREITCCIHFYLGEHCLSSLMSKCQDRELEQVQLEDSLTCVIIDFKWTTGNAVRLTSYSLVLCAKSSIHNALEMKRKTKQCDFLQIKHWPP